MIITDKINARITKLKNELIDDQDLLNRHKEQVNILTTKLISKTGALAELGTLLVKDTRQQKLDEEPK